MIGSKIKEDLIQKIKDPFNGEFTKGTFLPSVRNLSESFSVAPLTISRLLKSMESEGFVKSIPRKGFEIIFNVKKPKKSGVIVYLSSNDVQVNDWDYARKTRQSELQVAASENDWPLVSIDVSKLKTEQIMEKLSQFNIVGVVLDRIYKGVLLKLNEQSIPSICLDVWFQYFDIDEISRDEFQGARIAGDYAIKQDHSSFGWIGPIKNNANGQVRFSAVNSSLISAGFEFSNEWVVEVEIDAEKKYLEKILSRKNRPKVLFVFWKDLALKVARVAESLNLKLGHDLIVIGWCTVEQYEAEYLSVCPMLANKCPTVTWSIGEIARACIQRIHDRIIEPNRPTQRILLPMKLAFID